VALKLLDAINLLFQRVREVDSRGELTSLTDSARQTKIDLAKQCWNQVIIALYENGRQPVPTQSRIGTITLEEGRRKYSLPDNLVHLWFPLRHQANSQQEAQGWRIHAYAQEEEDGGYSLMQRQDLFPATTLGRPQRAVITPDRRELFVDRTPTEEEAGDIYEFDYSKSFWLSSPNDIFPITDYAIYALLPAVAELWRSDYQNARNSMVFRESLATAARILRPIAPRTHW